MSERSLVRHLRQIAGRQSRLALGIGDDCAIYRPRAGEELLFTTDLLLEDVHFRRDTHTAADCGWKALARGLSDIAAMGGKPLFSLVSLAAPDGAWVRGFYRGLLQLAEREGCDLAGGDLSRADRIACDIVVTGTVPPGKALLRDGAREGDNIYVSGALGASALGLAKGKGRAWKRHLRPEPRLALGQALRSRGDVTAAMDLSDGLSIDLARLLEASGAAAELDGDLPVFRGASIEQALHGGEDYELLFTARGRLPEALAGVPVTRIGTIRKGQPGVIHIAGGILKPLGWDHFA